MLNPLRHPLNQLNGSAGLYARAFIGSRAASVRRHWFDGDRGASAVELAIITGVLVIMAVGILALIWKEVGAGQSNINKVIPTSTNAGG